MEFQVPNRSYMIDCRVIISKVLPIYKEKTFGRSRFDYIFETDNKKVFIEVMSNLREDNTAMFPDAPTTRVKHINE